MVPFYPPGFPLHLAAAGILWGWHYAPHFVSPFAALFLVVATYFLARELELSRLLALVAASILGGCAVLLFQASQATSDVVAALWATAAVVFALRSRKRDIWAVLAGASFGLAVLVRPTNAVLALPLLLALPWRWKAFALFGGGGAPFALFEARWNSTVYGGALRTGYGGVGDFALANFPARFTHSVHTIAQMFSPLVPLGWLAVGADRRLSIRDRALLSVWFAAYLLMDCFRGPHEAWWSTRDLIPAFPALVVGAVLVARDLLSWVTEAGPGPLRSPGAAIAIACAFFLVVANAERSGIVRWKPLEVAEGEQTYPMACDLARSKLPERSLVVSMQMSGALRYYTDLQPVRWDRLQPGDFAQLRQKAAEKDYPIYALLAPFEEEAGALTERVRERGNSSQGPATSSCGSWSEERPLPSPQVRRQGRRRRVPAGEDPEGGGDPVAQRQTRAHREVTGPAERSRDAPAGPRHDHRVVAPRWIAGEILVLEGEPAPDEIAAGPGRDGDGIQLWQQQGDELPSVGALCDDVEETPDGGQDRRGPHRLGKIGALDRCFQERLCPPRGRQGLEEPLRAGELLGRPLRPRRARPLVEVEEALGLQGGGDTREQLLDRSDMVERLMEEHGVVPPARQAQGIEVRRPIGDPAEALLVRVRAGFGERGFRSVDALDGLAETQAARRTLEGPGPAAEREGSPERARDVSAMEPV